MCDTYDVLSLHNTGHYNESIRAKSLRGGNIFNARAIHYNHKYTNKPGIP